MDQPVVIFHSRAESRVSPALHGHWLRSPADLVIESGAAGGFANDPEIACGHFIWWCLSRTPAVVQHLAPVNLPGVQWGDDWDAAAWFVRLVDDLKRWTPPPVLVDLDGYAVTQGGVVLWASSSARKAEQRASADVGGLDASPC
jgi:hypothetical protein